MSKLRFSLSESSFRRAIVPIIYTNSSHFFVSYFILLFCINHWSFGPISGMLSWPNESNVIKIFRTENPPPSSLKFKVQILGRATVLLSWNCEGACSPMCQLPSYLWMVSPTYPHHSSLHKITLHTPVSTVERLCHLTKWHLNCSHYLVLCQAYLLMNVIKCSY